MDGAPFDLRPFGFAFIGGARKSGTTWLLRMLAGHPEIIGMGEGFFVGEPESGWGLTPCVDEERVRRWSALRPVRESWTAGVSPQEAARLAMRGMIEGLMRAAVRRLGDSAGWEGGGHGSVFKPGGRVLLDKTAYSHSVNAERLHALFPEAVFIDIVRDGRDAAVSDLFMLLARPTADGQFPAEERAHLTAARAWFIERRSGAPEVRLFSRFFLERSAREWAAATAGSERALSMFTGRSARVCYEELIAADERDQRAILAGLLGLLGVDAGESACEACRAAGEFSELTGGRARGTEDRQSFFRKGVAGEWRTYMNEEEQRVFSEIAGSELARLGYVER